MIILSEFFTLVVHYLMAYYPTVRGQHSNFAVSNCTKSFIVTIFSLSLSRILFNKIFIEIISFVASNYDLVMPFNELWLSYEGIMDEMKTGESYDRITHWVSVLC